MVQDHNIYQRSQSRQHALREKIFWTATSFSPQLCSSSGQDNRIYTYTEIEYRNLELSTLFFMYYIYIYIYI